MQDRRGKFKKDLNFEFSHSEDRGFDMHFCPTGAKIKVATSVCTDIGSNPIPTKLKTPTTVVVGVFNGRG